jgi:hypothetical protein
MTLRNPYIVMGILVILMAQLEYWEGSDIHDLTYDEMVDEIEHYIAFVRRVYFMYPDYDDCTGYVRIGFHKKWNMDRWELVAFQPPLDSVYTTTAVVDAMVEKYPDLLVEPGRNMVPCQNCGGANITKEAFDRVDGPAGEYAKITCNDCGHVEHHGYTVKKYGKHYIRMEW